ncbi:MAG: transposase [Bacteroidetes bacterium]|nr:transposase [Bacteroidota bacterium]
MATFKAEIRSDQIRRDGTRNVRIRVTHNRKNRYISTQLYVVASDLTRSGKIKTQSIIDTAENIIKKYRKICNDHAEDLENMTVEQVVNLITEYKDGFKLDFIQYGKDVANKLRQTGHTGNAGTYEVAVNAVARYLGKNSVDISEITAKLLSDFIKWLQTIPSEHTKKILSRAPSLYIANLKALHNMAKAEFNDEEAGIINIPRSPFKYIDIPAIPASSPHPTTPEVIKAMYNLPDATDWGKIRFNLAKDVFLLSFFLCGMNTADLYECDDIQHGRITYCRKKTKNRREDKAKISIKIEPEAESLIKKWQDPTGQRVFRFYTIYSNPNTFSTAIKKGLKQVQSVLINNEIVRLSGKKIEKIDPKELEKWGKRIFQEFINGKDLIPYTARHTWGSIARNKAGVDKYDVHFALNHVDPDMKATDHYIEKDWSIIDKANRKVIDYILK